MPSSKYHQIKDMIRESGINFSEIPKEEIIKYCNNCSGLPGQIYAIIIEIIDGINNDNLMAPKNWHILK